MNLLSGNSLLHLTVFAIGILPYITASIIVQLLTQVIPRLETLRKEGQAGQAKITQYTRYVSVGLGLLYAVVYVQAARTGAAFSGSGCGPTFHPLIPKPDPVHHPHHGDHDGVGHRGDHAVTTLIVFIEQGQRRIPVQYAKRITGRRVYGGGPRSSR